MSPLSLSTISGRACFCVKLRAQFHGQKSIEGPWCNSHGCTQSVSLWNIGRAYTQYGQCTATWGVVHPENKKTCHSPGTLPAVYTDGLHSSAKPCVCDCKCRTKDYKTPLRPGPSHLWGRRDAGSEMSGFLSVHSGWRLLIYFSVPQLRMWKTSKHGNNHTYRQECLWLHHNSNKWSSTKLLLE